MSWRKHVTHAEETRAVKQALAEAGIKAKVGHGTGTAWSWLEINLELNGSDCPQLKRQALSIAKRVTGRHGEYDGDILILAQK